MAAGHRFRLLPHDRASWGKTFEATISISANIVRALAHADRQIRQARRHAKLCLACGNGVCPEYVERWDDL